jgi:hypothetical protein
MRIKTPDANKNTGQRRILQEIPLFLSANILLFSPRRGLPTAQPAIHEKFLIFAAGPPALQFFVYSAASHTAGKLIDKITIFRPD